MGSDSIQEKFRAALDALVEQVKQDRSVLAAVVCGSLSHDSVWARSDIDLVLVTIDDRKVECSDLALYADGLNVHTILIPRAEFRSLVEGSRRNSFMHSFLAKGRLLYTHDETIAGLFARLGDIGERDTELQLLRAGATALPAIDKARKWFVTRGDLEYTALWILHAARSLAEVEVIGRRLLADREVLPQAAALNRDFFDTVYIEPLNARKTRKGVKAALDALDAYVAERAPSLFRLVVDYLREAGEARSASDIEHHFERHFDVSGVTTACEYLAARGLIGKASLPVHLTKKSNIEVEELAFFWTGAIDEQTSDGCR